MKKDRTQDKTPYEPTLAKQIIEQYGLKPAVEKIWKTRGHIPGAYLTHDGGIDPSPKLNARDPMLQKIRTIFNDKRIASSKFRTLGIKGPDLAAGKRSLTAAELTGILTEITELRNLCRKAIDTRSAQHIGALLKDVRLHPTNILPDKLYRRIKENALLSPTEKEEIRIHIMALNNFIKVA